MRSLTILSPCGILGYGFPDASFAYGLSQKPDAIVVDAGSTDAGPHKLGAKTAIVSRRAAKKDLLRIIKGGCELAYPYSSDRPVAAAGEAMFAGRGLIDEISGEHPDGIPRLPVIGRYSQ